MMVKDILEVIVVPIVLAILALAWPAIQSWNRRQAFRGLILRELEEIAPYPEEAEDIGWWAHQQKNFVHQKIFQDASENREFILSLEPDLVYFVSQLWDAKTSKNERQWLNYLEKLSDPKYDRVGRIDHARQKWKVLCDKYRAKNQQ
jgi:hypothetical protein